MNEEQFDHLYTDSYTRLVGHIYAMCGNLPEAQDCVQEAFIRAWDKRQTLNHTDNPEAWIRTTAYRLAISRWRKTIRALRPPPTARCRPNPSPNPAPTASPSPPPSRNSPPTNDEPSSSTTSATSPSPK